MNGIPADKLERALRALNKLPEISHVDCVSSLRMISAETDQPTMDCLQTVWRLSFSIRNAYLAKPIKCLRRIGIGGGEFGEIEVMQIVCST